jgi:hypothetical protein
VSYESAVTIVLSVLSVAIMILSVVIALAAAWGFRRIKRDAGETAARMAREMLCAYVGSPEWIQHVEKEIRRSVEQEADRLFEDLATVAAYSEPPRCSGSEVARPYPEEEDQPDAAR